MTDVSVGSGRHDGAHLDGHQHGVSVQIPIKLGKKFLCICRLRKINAVNCGESLCIFTIFLFPDSGLCLLKSFYLAWHWKPAIETELARAVEVMMARGKGICILMIKSKQVVFLFFVPVFFKRNKKTCTPCCYRVIKTLVKVWKNSKKLNSRSPNFHLSFYLRNRKHVSCFYRVLKARVEVWEILFSISLNCGIKIKPTPKSTSCCTYWTGVEHEFNN